MSDLTIRTDHKFRNLIYGYELTPKEREDFDYIDAADFDTHDFFRYKGRVYDPSEFTIAPADMADWHGVQGDSYFSGIVIRYSSDHERVKVGTYFC